MREPLDGPERADLELDQEARRDRRWPAIVRDWVTVGLAAVGLGTALVTLWKYGLS